MGDEWITKICCMGAGYVGGPTMAVIAKQCPKVRGRRRNTKTSVGCCSAVIERVTREDENPSDGLLMNLYGKRQIILQRSQCASPAGRRSIL
jgi:hypothetical protein